MEWLHNWAQVTEPVSGGTEPKRRWSESTVNSRCGTAFCLTCCSLRHPLASRSCRYLAEDSQAVCILVSPLCCGWMLSCRGGQDKVGRKGLALSGGPPHGPAGHTRSRDLLLHWMEHGHFTRPSRRSLRSQGRAGAAADGWVPSSAPSAFTSVVRPRWWFGTGCARSVYSGKGQALQIRVNSAGQSQ